jgi:hypothetical protein
VKKRLNSEQQEKKEIFVDERSSSDKKRKFDSEERVSSALSELDLQNLGSHFYPYEVSSNFSLDLTNSLDVFNKYLQKNILLR